MSNKVTNAHNFISFGTYSADEADILKAEFERSGIPTKILYPGTNFGKESLAHAQWSAYTILIPARSRKHALEICSKLNIKSRYKMPLPKVLYTKANRFIIGVAILLWFLMIVFGLSGLLENRAVRNCLLIFLILVTMILFFVIGYGSFTNWRKKNDVSVH